MPAQQICKRVHITSGNGLQKGIKDVSCPLRLQAALLSARVDHSKLLHFSFMEAGVCLNRPVSEEERGGVS